MKRIFIAFIILISWGSLITAQNIIPQPLKIEKAKGSYTIHSKTTIIADEASQVNAEYLRDLLSPAFSLKIKQNGEEGILLKMDQNLEAELGQEGYLLEVSKKAIIISASSQNGIFYGIQTLRQMMPLDLNESQTKIKLSGVSITDYPRFEWRALMLDEARHFKGMEQVKKILDEMAMLKMNVFHWHLSDDQGWRIEIKKYPRLTEVGGFRKDTQTGGWNSEERSGEAHGGFYTQEEIKEVIAYATARQITIIPEIEMPGHASAAIAAYPWLGTIGDEIDVPVIFGKLPDSYNVSDPKVYEFIEDVLSEVMELFPSKIIHIGGDEVKFDAWKDSEEVQEFMKSKDLSTPADLQIYFTNKVSNYIDENKHRMMGWNEILGSNIHEWQKDSDFQVKEKLASNAIVHFWKGNIELVNDAVSQGYDIVNSHHIDTYLDYSYDYTPLEKAYAFDPIPADLDPKYHSKVLGSGCQMWSEWIPEVADMDRMIFPRIAAYAEIGWTFPERKNYETFRSNLEPILQKWEKEGIQYSPKFEKKHFEQDKIKNNE